MTSGMFQSLPETLSAVGVDALVLDTDLFYAELLPLSLGMPYVHVSNARHFDWSGYTPLPVYDWPYETGPQAFQRNRKGVADLRNIVNKANGGARAYAERIGLKIDWEHPEATLSKLAWLTQIPKEFDFESSHWPPQLRHTGPFMTAWPHRCRIPMGTIDWRTARLRIDGNTAEPCGQRFSHNCATSTPKNVQIVLSLGEHVDPKEIGPLPTTAITVKWAPQLELLKRASVCITHAD